MAGEEKKFPLSIILRTVDKYSAGLKLANERIDAAFKPYRTFGKELSAFSKNLGLPGLQSSLAGVGREIKSLTMGAATLGAVAIGVGAHVFKKWVDDFDKLRDSARILGLSVDSLAQLRFVGGQEGVEDLDGALEKMSKGIGEARAKTGSLYSFLGKVSPTLRKQVLATKSNEEALFLMADAMKKIEDPAKRAAFATKVFGKSGQPLINMLSGGSDAIRAQMREYFELAGSQEDAANKADDINDAMGRVNAGLARVKASIVTGLGPAIEKIAGRMQAWLKDPENQKRITDWIEDFGTKLPARIDAFVDAIRGIVDAIKPIWEALGGAKGALLAFVAVQTAPLVASLLGVVAALGKVIAGIRAATTAATVAGGAGTAGGVAGAARGLGGLGTLGIVGAGLAVGLSGPKLIDTLQGAGYGSLGNVIDMTVGGARGQVAAGMGPPVAAGMQPNAPIAPQAQAPAEAKIVVDFKNAPKGTRVDKSPGDTADVDLNVGYQMGVP